MSECTMETICTRCSHRPVCLFKDGVISEIDKINKIVNNANDMLSENVMVADIQCKYRAVDQKIEKIFNV